MLLIAIPELVLALTPQTCLLIMSHHRDVVVVHLLVLGRNELVPLLPQIGLGNKMAGIHKSEDLIHVSLGSQLMLHFPKELGEHMGTDLLTSAGKDGVIRGVLGQSETTEKLSSYIFLEHHLQLAITQIF